MHVDLNTLINLKFAGDLESFISAWDRTLLAMRRPPEEDLLLAVLEPELRKCQSLAPEFVIYDGADNDSEIRTRKWLYNSARRAIGRQMRLDTKAALLEQPGRRALPARQKSDTDNKDKGGDNIKKCFQFLKTGECKFGKNCKFSHAVTEKDKTVPMCKFSSRARAPKKTSAASRTKGRGSRARRSRRRTEGATWP